ncbi:RpiR family transcriptional regulator [Eilatimonas milleporae]|uniref:RpiR family transcriptional regulator n=1 Tax=Eilatimonas milleporae TaxID=911205 RepID=A0A3M0CC20_9PROT|nr:MurR/RpiR family transcriptional regulator [Eilatimonas milleporae]RMB00573.1 RpiR family transcriptional regulator [Eilatimonas milleporae]
MSARINKTGVSGAASPPARRGRRRHKPVEGVLSRLQAGLDSLSPTSRRIAAHIVAHAHDVVQMSITELADTVGASEGAVVKLCQQIGTTGFQQLKLSLAQDLVNPTQYIHEDLDPRDTTGRVIEKIFASGMQAMQDTLRVLDPDEMGKAVDALLAADRVELYGIGSAAPIAEDAYYRMLRIGMNCRLAVDSHAQAICASLTDERVAVLTVSHSGSTQETIAATRLAKEAGAKTIVITNFGKSPIQRHADVVLQTMARETRFRTEAMTSRLVQLAIVDALIACLALANHDDAVETLRHTFDVLSTKRI